MREGQGTLELLIALAIIIISVSAAISVFFGGQSLLIDTQLSSEAYNLARGRVEEARSQARQNFGGLTSSSSTSGIFLKETIVSSIDTYTKRVTSRVSWQTEPLRPQKVEVVAILTDWRNASPPDPGDPGGGGISGNWQNPRTLGTVDLGPGNSATDLDVISKIVYISAEASSAAKPDFFIVDATNGESPFIVSSINTGPSLLAVDASTNYAYVGNKSTTAQLQIIDVSNISNPTTTSSFQLPGVSGSGAIGQTVFYASGKAYVGTKKATGPEFHIVDVSNPASPSALGSKEINADVNGIYVNGTIAYVATSDTEELKIFDVSNPASISQLSGYDAPGDSEDGKSLWLVASTLYLGRLLGGNHDDHHELHIIDVSSSTSPQNLGSKDIAADVNDLRVRDNLAFLATDDANKEFQVWDISNPSNITFWSSFNFPQVGTGVDYEDNLVYVSVRSNDALRIIASSP